MSDTFSKVEVIIGVARRRRFSTDLKLAVVAETMQPGISISYVARLVSGQQRARILELGAGIGNVARLFRAIHGAARYSICDLPETLIFARFYLSIERPGASFELCVGANNVR
jgi:hypothetical protein